MPIRTQVRPVPLFQIKQQPTHNGAINFIPEIFKMAVSCTGIS